MDLFFSVRQLAKTPGFTVAAVIVLALGIGLNAAMFGLVYAFGFSSRPYSDPDRVVQLYSSQTTAPDSYRAFSYPAYQQIAATEGPFEGVLAHAPTVVGVGDGGGDTRRAFGAIVSRNYFDVLSVPIVEGRGFTVEEDRPGQDVPVVVVSYAYWQRRGLDPRLVGSVIRVNERAFTIVGITPRGFTGTMAVFGPDVYFPFGVFHTVSSDFDGEAGRRLEPADSYALFLVGRLRAGVSREAADARLAALGPELARAYPAEYVDARVTIAPLPRLGTSTSPSDESVLGLLGVVMLGLTAAVLLTVCLNLAAMLLARGRARRKEFAIRLSLGGSRAQIVGQLLTEGLLLALAGGVGGILLGNYAIERLIAALASALPITLVLDNSVSPALMLATLGFCVMATLWFALGPALRHSRADILSDLKPQAGEDTPVRRHALLPRHPLLVAQVALSLTLLIAAGLFVRMAQTALAVEFGFHADDTVLAEVDTRLGGYDAAQGLDVMAHVAGRLAALPGVETVAVGAVVPMGMVNLSATVRRAGIVVPDDARPQTPEAGRGYSAPWNAVSAGYFSAMGMPVRRGRTFTDAESFTKGTRRVVILDERLASQLWPDGEAVGQLVEFVEKSPGDAPAVMEVVGVVAAVRRQLFEKELPGAVYVPFAQDPRSNAYLHVKPAIAGADLSASVRQEIRAAAPGVPLFSARTFRSHMDGAVEYWALRFAAATFALFGAFAMLVALVGIYGVMSYAVTRRTREIGIRIAVGATAGGVSRMMIGEGLRTALVGVTIGWLLGIGVGRLLASVFVDVSAFDGVIFTAIPVAFVAASLIASWLPARRATRISPTTALRAD